MKALRLLVICVFGFIAYAIWDTDKDRSHISEIRAKEPSLLSAQDKIDLKAADEKDRQAKKRRLEHEKSEAAEMEKTKGKRQELENMINVRVACEEVARGLLKSPSSYERESTADKVAVMNGIKYYTFNLHYSGVNAFNVRSISKILCYAPANSSGEQISYRTSDN